MLLDMNGTEDLLALKKAFRLVAEEIIEEKIRPYMKTKKMTVTTEYNPETKKVGVTEAFGTEIVIPTISTLSEAELTVGVSVWVIMPYSSMSNAIVFMTCDGNVG